MMYRNKANEPVTSEVLMLIQPFAYFNITSVGKKILTS